MTAPLWTSEELTRAASAAWDGSLTDVITGFSLDTRALQAGEIFVALKDVRDGHEFVGKAFAANAAGAIVRQEYKSGPGDGALLRVADPLAALVAIGRAARARTAARIIAVTGSVGKTGTKEMLRAVLGRLGPTHAPEKSFNNHWGVPLTLARMPAASAFGVFEIGMSHAGEITPLTAMVRPDVAIVTTVEPVHIENFASVDGIAEAKAEIFTGLQPGGVAIVNDDNAWADVLAARASACGAKVLRFGHNAGADVRVTDIVLEATGSTVRAAHQGTDHGWRVGAPGAHIAQNSVAVLAALIALGLDRAAIATAMQALAQTAAPAGRGARTVLKADAGRLLLIDESYNANPASMRAALAALAMVPRENFPRRIAVLGDMLELGPDAPALHEGLFDAVDAAGVDLVFAAGPNMQRLYDRLAAPRRGASAPASSSIEAALLGALGAGDVVMIKGSFGSRMGPLVDAIKQRFAIETLEPG